MDFYTYSALFFVIPAILTSLFSDMLQGNRVLKKVIEHLLRAELVWIMSSHGSVSTPKTTLWNTTNLEAVIHSFPELLILDLQSRNNKQPWQKKMIHWIAKQEEFTETHLVVFNSRDTLGF